MSVIENSVEVDVPVRVAYDQRTQFEDFPRFMEGVEEVEQIDDVRLRWRVSIGGADREFEARIEEQEPDRHITWRATEGAEQSGTVTFEPLGDERATRPAVGEARSKGTSRSMVRSGPPPSPHDRAKLPISLRAPSSLRATCPVSPTAGSERPRPGPTSPSRPPTSPGIAIARPSGQLTSDPLRDVDIVGVSTDAQAAPLRRGLTSPDPGRDPLPKGEAQAGAPDGARFTRGQGAGCVGSVEEGFPSRSATGRMLVPGGFERGEVGHRVLRSAAASESTTSGHVLAMFGWRVLDRVASSWT